MPYLKVKKGEVLNTSGVRVLNFPLDKAIVTIGRSANNDLQLVGSKKVSRYHAAIIKLKDPKDSANPIDSYFIRDLGSLHFTLVNGDIVYRKQLEDADMIEIEGIRLEYNISQLLEEKKCPIEIINTQIEKSRQSRVNGGTNGSTIFPTIFPFKEFIPSLPFPLQQTMIDLLSLIKQAETTSSLIEGSIKFILDIVGAKRGFIVLITGSNKITEWAMGKKGDSFQVDPILVNQVMEGRSYYDNYKIAIPIRELNMVLGFIYLSGQIAEKNAQIVTIIASSIGKRIKEIRYSKRIKRNKSIDGPILEWAVNKISHSKTMSEIYSKIREIATKDIDILVLGETGSGKEGVAKEIYRLSHRATNPYVLVNCTKLVEPNLSHSELFGHKKGTFTNALTDRKGAFQEAHTGTIFLDEIGEIKEDIQNKLLRVILERQIQPLGSNNTIKVDVRIITATNRPLQSYVQQGKFKKDLYYRLMKGIVIKVPPLKERDEDIPLLAHFYLDKYAKEFSSNIKGLSHGAIQMLMGYYWPGNINELEGYIKRSVAEIKEGKEFIFIRDLPTEIKTYVLQKKGDKERFKTLKELEREEIKRVLGATSWNKTRAAKTLGISRVTLNNKIREYNIKTS